jgi:transcription elongation factor Elf1
VQHLPGYFTVLYCTVLYCTVLYCTVYCTVLCTVLYCTVCDLPSALVTSREGEVPQLQDISDTLQQVTGWQVSSRMTS